MIYNDYEIIFSSCPSSELKEITNEKELEIITFCGEGEAYASELKGRLTQNTGKTCPGVSVLIPMFNAGEYISECLQSVCGQEHISEILIADDGSGDECAKNVIRFFSEHRTDLPGNVRCALLRWSHHGQAKSRNLLVTASRGDFIYFTDADDVPAENAVDTLVKASAAHPEYKFFESLCRDFISPDLSEAEAAELQIQPDPYRRNLAGCVLLRRELFEMLGGYNEELKSSETAEWMLRLNDAGKKAFFVPEVTLQRRYHRSNFGRISRLQQLESYRNIIRQRMLAKLKQ